MTMPSTMLNWKKATKRPRQCDGEISAIYIGPTTDEAPTASPPRAHPPRENSSPRESPPMLPTAEIR